jgi:hypothetical protein
MHTGVISFCNRISFNIKSSEIKDVILNDLNSRFAIKILQKHWHRLDEHNKDHLQRAPHFMMLRSNGNPYYMYLTRYEDVNQIMFIDKKVQPGYEKPRIILVRGRFKDELFDNTLLEGEMVKDERNQWIFLINDVIGYRGKYLEHETFPKRLSKAYEMFKGMYRADPLMDVCQFHVKKVYPAIQQHWNDILELNQNLPYTNRGVYMWPFMLKYKPKLMNFDDTLIKTVTRKVKDDPMFRESLPYPSPSPPPSPGPRQTPLESSPPVELTKHEMKTNERILYLRKTENPDVYNLYELENSSDKMGLAHIPNLQVSKKLRHIFKDLTVATTVPFICSYEEKFQKWIPLDVTTKRV